MSDNVHHPAHYTAGAVECIDALEAATTGLSGGEAICTATAIKYLWRWKLKNGVEDLKKARWYLDRLISKLEPLVARFVTVSAVIGTEPANIGAQYLKQLKAEWKERVTERFQNEAARPAETATDQLRRILDEVLG